MMRKYLWYILLTSLLILLGTPSSQAQLSNNPDAWINNPLGVKPLYLHFGRGALYLSALTGIAYYVTRKNKELEDKRLSFYFENGTMFSYKYPNTIIPESNVGVNYKVTKWLAYGADMGIYFPRDNFNQATGLSMLRIYNKMYFVDNDKFRLWFENGVGVVYFTNTFPKKTDRSERTGTNWNGVVKYGFGSEFNINPSLSVLVGLRHLHFSNADIRGKIRNPSSDSHGVFIGVNYNPRRLPNSVN
jgi:opacity protein-like surface antigen